ncbi:MAG: zinc-ribbon domain-containing protein [Promethearchaeota archaeon]
MRIPTIFSTITATFLVILVIAVIFFIIILLIVYKLIHSNVNNVKKRSEPYDKVTYENIRKLPSNNDFKKKKLQDNSLTCRYCGEQVRENVNFCPLCGSFLK